MGHPRRQDDGAADLERGTAEMRPRLLPWEYGTDRGCGRTGPGERRCGRGLGSGRTLTSKL